MDKSVEIPIDAGDWFVIDSLGFSSIVLPIMSIYTQGTVMLEIVEWTPDSFEIENEKIFIVFHIVNKFNFDITFMMAGDWNMGGEEKR